MEQWHNSKNTELHSLLLQISDKFKELALIYAEEEKKKLERLIELQKTYIDNAPK
jgi:hypothetical protein